MRSEFATISAGFDLLPVFTANGGKAVVVNPGGTALTVTVGTLALAGNLSTTGAFNTIFAQGASVTLTLPIVNGTLATLAGTETLSNKTLVAPALGTPASGVATNLTGTAAGLTAGTATNQSGGSVAATTLSASGAVSGAGFVALHASPGPIGSTAASTGAFTTLSATSTVSGAGFTAWAASPPAIGGTVPAAGAFTTLSASGAVSGAGFTALFASPPAIGGSAPAAGAFTTLSTTGILTTLTAAPGTNTTQAATTAYSTAAVAVEAAARVTATGLLIARDGSQPPTADIPMGTHKLTGLSNGSAAADSVALGQLTGAASLALNALSLAATGAITAATAGTTGNQVVNFSQFAPLLAAVGYIHLPGGVTFQWGNASSTVGTVTVTFPVSFSTGVWAIAPMLKDAPGGGPAQPVAIEATTVATNAGFNVLTFNTTTGALAACNFFWIAVGPT